MEANDLTEEQSQALLRFRVSFRRQTPPIVSRNSSLGVYTY